MKLSIVSAALLATAALVLTGCAASGSTPAGDSGTSAEESLAAVLEAGTLTVGTEGTYRPFSFHEDGSGPLTGYDVEVIEAVADELGVSVTFEETQWDAIFAGLTNGRFDVVANQVSLTPERLEAYAFSTPYTYSTGVIVVPSDNTDITSFASLDGKTTAQSLTSNWNALAVASGATVEGVEGWAQSVALVEQGRVDATINDKLTFLDYALQNEADGLKIAAETEERSESAFAFAPSNTSLADAVSDALETLRANGTLSTISEKYFGADVSQ
jgi:cystine transport system substrate-binding protein